MRVAQRSLTAGASNIEESFAFLRRGLDSGGVALAKTPVIDASITGVPKVRP